MEKYTNIPALSRKLFLDTMMVLITAELADSLCGIIDGVVVGRFLGADALAAHGVATPIFLVLCIFSYMITIGFQQPCTVALGKGKLREANGLYSFTLLLTLGVALASTVLGVVFPHFTARLMGAGNGPIRDMAADYLQAVSMGYPALLFFLVLIPILQIEGRWNLVQIGSVVMSVSDIVLDLVNVNVFHLGIRGVGWATAGSYFLGLLVLLSYFFHKPRFFHFRFKDLRETNLSPMLFSGIPAGIRTGARALSNVLMSTLTMSLAGATAMTALAVQRNISYVSLSVGVGISDAVLLLTGISYGEQDRRGLMDVVRMSARNSIWLGGGLGVLVFAFAPLLSSLFLEQAGASTELIVFALRCLALSMPFIIWNRCTGAYLQGIGNNGLAIVLYLCVELVSLAGAAWLMGLVWGAKGIFAAFPVSQLALTLLVNLVAWLRRDRRYSGMEAYLNTPPSFGVPPEDRLERTLTRPEEVWSFSKEAQTFCEERDVTSDKAYWVSLYIEEMGNLIMTYGFADGKTHNLEIRLSLHPSSVILRFRDDCRRWNIKEKAAHWQEDPAHPEASLGIRMVMQACKKMEYNNSLNSNNLMVLL